MYYLFLFDGRVVDKPLTDWSTKVTVKCLRILYPNKKIEFNEECCIVKESNQSITCVDYINNDGIKILGVADGCNALEIYVLYVGFLFAFPASFKRVFLFSVLGVILIYLSNVVRLTTLAIMNIGLMNTVDIAHHYLFKMIVYILIFLLWILFTKKNDTKIT